MKKSLKTMNEEEILIQLEIILQKHDHLFAMTDDPRLYEQGLKEQEEIEFLLSQARKMNFEKESLEIYEKYR